MFIKTSLKAYGKINLYLKVIKKLKNNKFIKSFKIIPQNKTDFIDYYKNQTK